MMDCRTLKANFLVFNQGDQTPFSLILFSEIQANFV